MTKVLLVEDDNNLREIFEMRLQADGFQTLTASDGEEALVVAMREKPDLIVADIMMPKLSGFEMLETLRASPEMKNTRVIMMTALGQAEDQARGEKLGVLKYLVKSQVTLEDFAKVVNEILKPGPKSSEESSSPSGDEAKSSSDSVSNNQQESEKSMPEDTTPTNPSTPAPDAAAPAGDNPVSTPAADADTTDQATTAQAQDDVQNQINDFAASPTPAPDAAAPADPTAVPATDASAAPDVPVSAPPAEGDDTAPAPSEPTPPPAV